MGNFYTNFAVRGDDPARVVEALRARGQSAYVTPASGGTIMVYDESTESQDKKVILKLGAELSTELGAPILAVLNHDDDVLRYWLFRGDSLVDEYNSFPGYFEEGGDEPSGGSADRLADFFNTAAVGEILRGAPRAAFRLRLRKA